eukprot:616445-Prorocentrum_minimum.AAC.1
MSRARYGLLHNAHDEWWGAYDVKTSLAHASVGCVCRMTSWAHGGGLIGVFSENNAVITDFRAL